jgi:uncharacterized membrane protein (UPF0127 family)
MRVKFSLFALGGILVVGGSIGALNYVVPGAVFGSLGDHSYIHGVPILLEVVDTEEARVKGLSGRERLPDGRGMLFVFDTEDKYGIWMKDMKFPIDILWLDSEHRIVAVEHVVTPETYPKVFYPSVPARFVLELPAGFAKENDFKIGDRLMRSSFTRAKGLFSFFPF